MDATTGYAKRAGGHLAFSVVGSGPIDLLYMSSNTISIDSLDEEPHVARYFGRLASFSRLIRFDIRGVGLSDPIDASRPPTVEDMAQDAIAVLDAVASPTRGSSSSSSCSQPASCRRAHAAR